MGSVCRKGSAEDELVDRNASEASEDDLPSVVSSTSPGAKTDDFFRAPKTPPKKKRKRDVPQDDSRPSSPTERTPRKPRTKTVVHPTPHSKASLLRNKNRRDTGLGTPSRRRGAGKLAVTQQAVDYAAQEDLSHLPKDPRLRAMHVLHVGSRPDALLYREGEFDKVLRCVGELLFPLP